MPSKNHGGDEIAAHEHGSQELRTVKNPRTNKAEEGWKKEISTLGKPNVSLRDVSCLRRHSLPNIEASIPPQRSLSFATAPSRAGWNWADHVKQLFASWERIEQLRSELLVHHSDAIYSWRVFDRRQQKLQDNQSELSKAISDGLRLQDVDTLIRDRLEAAEDRINQDIHEIQQHCHRCQALESTRAKLDYDIAMEESALLYHLRVFIGNLPEELSDTEFVEKYMARNTTHESRQPPEPLQRYYDAVGWVGVLEERLEDLRSHQLEERRFNPSLSSPGKPPVYQLSESELRFQNDEIDLLRQLDEAQRQAQTLEKQALDQGVQIEPFLDSKSRTSKEALQIGHFDPSARSLASSVNREQLNSTSRDQKSISVLHDKTTSQQHQNRSAFAGAGAAISQWVQKIRRRIHRRTQQSTDDEVRFSDISMHSVKSLPDCVLVDTVRLEWAKSTESERAKNYQLRQKQESMGMSAIRTFAHKRPIHSDSSLLARTSRNKTVSGFR